MTGLLIENGWRLLTTPGRIVALRDNPTETFDVRALHVGANAFAGGRVDR
ncbi:MAG TPA: hypothetical protein QGI07_07120 [Dehalococcoidia bacterium]|jgi:hypothetical protein|nr:hypothetical protein [Dehalococcoidia bacterium]MDP6272885.1 hypothetical protein [Dehalococcoidia bacterium]MDP7160710.1 hypothetical protein [Dehalococcoidia bacterium]MDP7213757.1 hypothetical protein [Dehalococcoidia bacterium]MDP7514551.1 hypothetical protein [Dehalococcoidia bacterium]|tara:strand:- start:2379 stop:2528 length:150 start_codon:yes stop_codon:yes gene_type:complete